MRICVAGLGAPPPPWVQPKGCRPPVLGTVPGRCMVLRWGLVAMLPGPAHGPVHGGCREGGKAGYQTRALRKFSFYSLSVQVQCPCSI